MTWDEMDRLAAEIGDKRYEISDEQAQYITGVEYALMIERFGA